MKTAPTRSLYGYLDKGEPAYVGSLEGGKPGSCQQYFKVKDELCLRGEHRLVAEILNNDCMSCGSKAGALPKLGTWRHREMSK